MNEVKPFALWLTIGGFSFGLTGCGDRIARFTPKPAIAQSALEKALEAWHVGMPAGEIADGSPAIFVTDNGRKAGQTLIRYEILGETASSAGRSFAVRLFLEKPNEQLKTEYLVVGIDPLWIFRREDYELLMHWDHRMPKLPNENSATTKNIDAPVDGEKSLAPVNSGKGL